MNTQGTKKPKPKPTNLPIRGGATKKELMEENLELRKEIIVLKDWIEGLEQNEAEWQPLIGVHGIMSDLFYDGYHTSKLGGDIVKEVIQGIKELKEKIDFLTGVNEELVKDIAEVGEVIFDNWEGQTDGHTQSSDEDLIGNELIPLFKPTPAEQWPHLGWGKDALKKFVVECSDRSQELFFIRQYV